jgi:hypothetical protein
VRKFSKVIWKIENKSLELSKWHSIKKPLMQFMQIFTWIFIGWMWSRWLQSIFHLTESRREVLGVKEEKQCTNNSDDCDTFSWSVGERDERFEWLRKCEGCSIKSKGFQGLLTATNEVRNQFLNNDKRFSLSLSNKAFRKLVGKAMFVPLSLN